MAKSPSYSIGVDPGLSEGGGGGGHGKGEGWCPLEHKLLPTIELIDQILTFTRRHLMAFWTMINFMDLEPEAVFHGH